MSKSASTNISKEQTEGNDIDHTGNGDDYMNDSFLVSNEVDNNNSNKKRKASAKQKAVQPLRKKEVTELMKNNLEIGLLKSIGPENIGYKLMSKFGFASDIKPTGLGKDNVLAKYFCSTIVTLTY